MSGSNEIFDTTGGQFDIKADYLLVLKEVSHQYLQFFPKLRNFSTSTMMCCWTLFSSQFQAGFSSNITSLEIMTFWIFLNYKRDSLQIASYNREDTFFTYFIHLISLFFRHMRITYIFKHLHVVIDGL